MGGAKAGVRSLDSMGKGILFLGGKFLLERDALNVTIPGVRNRRRPLPSHEKVADCYFLADFT